jgi:hypothetical protein
VIYKEYLKRSRAYDLNTKEPFMLKQILKKCPQGVGPKSSLLLSQPSQLEINVLLPAALGRTQDFITGDYLLPAALGRTQDLITNLHLLPAAQRANSGLNHKSPSSACGPMGELRTFFSETVFFCPRPLGELGTF